DTNYNLATNTTAIIQNAHNDTDRVIAKLDAMVMARKVETISELRSQVNALNLAQSQANQNTYLINTLRPCPIPAYPACPPAGARSEEHTSEPQSRFDRVCRRLLEQKQRA